MPDFDFDAFNHDTPPEGAEHTESSAPVSENTEKTESEEPDNSPTGIAPAATPEIDSKPNDEEVDKW